MSEPAYLGANIERYMGFAEHYDKYRPSTPRVIIDILMQLAQTSRPHCVVDIGSGSGLSTRTWADHADEIIGIEPGDDMRRQAQVRSAGLGSVRYEKGLSTATGLPDGSADIVTISQALHWMEPFGTFAEVARLLRPGGVFAAFDNDWPPTFDWQAEAAFDAFMDRVAKLAAQGNHERDVKKWHKEQHLERMRASGRFRYTNEIAVHHVEQGDAERLVGIAMSQGAVQTLIKNGLSEEQIGVPEFRAEARRLLGDRSLPWYFIYRVRIGVK